MCDKTGSEKRTGTSYPLAPPVQVAVVLALVVAAAAAALDGGGSSGRGSGSDCCQLPLRVRQRLGHLEPARLPAAERGEPGAAEGLLAVLLGLLLLLLLSSSSSLVVFARGASGVVPRHRRSELILILAFDRALSGRVIGVGSRLLLLCPSSSSSSSSLFLPDL